MNNDKLSPLQLKLLEMMKWFHEFCEKNNIRYYVLGGTMLGAARHKGFIPWDDDIDIGLPRKEYEKLARLMQSTDCLPYVLETPDSTAKDYCYPYSKLYHTETTLVEKRRKNVVRGIFIDIFPLDGLGDNENECKKNYKPINRKYNFLLSVVGGISSEREWYKNLAVIAARMIPLFLLDYKKIIKQLNELCATKEFDACEWVCNDLGAWRIKEAMPRSFFGKPVLYQFEDIMVYGPEKYEDYLSHLYDTWETLPSMEKRVSHHDFIKLDLTSSYFSVKH